MPTRSRPMQQRWPKRCLRHAYWATSTRSPPGWRNCWQTSTLSSSRIAPDETSVGSRRPRARRRWPPRPKIWPPTQPTGKSPANGYTRSSKNGRQSEALDRKVNDTLGKRYSAARETSNRRRGSHFSKLDRERSGIRQSKERLCERAEELSNSTEWTTKSAEFRKLLAEWKTAGQTTQEIDVPVAPLQNGPGLLIHGSQCRVSGKRRRVAGQCHRQKGRCWLRQKNSTPPTTKPREQRRTRSPKNGTRSIGSS